MSPKRRSTQAGRATRPVRGAVRPVRRARRPLRRADTQLVETAILLFVSRHRLHRYGLYKALLDEGAALQDLRIVYRRIHKLEAGRMVTARWTAGRNRQPLRTYVITQRGRRELDGRLRAMGGRRALLASLRRIGTA